MFGSCLIRLQSTIPEISIVFLLQFILIIGDVETHSGLGTYDSNTPVKITNNNVDKYASINIRSVRNKKHFLKNFADEYDKNFASQNPI